MPDVPDQATPAAANGSSATAAAPPGAVRLPHVRALVRATQVRTVALTTIGLAAGLALLWVTKAVIGIEGDAVFIALLLVPVVVLLALNDKLQSFQIFGATAVFRDLQSNVTKLHENVTEVGENVTEVGEREPERASYLGKLGQVLDKDGTEFALIYADVNGLRQVSREIYLREKKAVEADGASTGDGSPKRRREQDIRGEIIDRLELALTDAFYDATSSLRRAKCDVFRLVDPDIAMIVRSVTSDQAEEIAEGVRVKTLRYDDNSFSTTIAVCPATTLEGKVTPRRIDEACALALQQAKGEKPRRRD